MDIRAHYDLPNDYIIDVEIQKPKECEGHIVSILARKGRNSLTQYVVNPTYFEELDNPIIKIETYDHYIGKEYHPNAALSIKNPADDKDLIYLLVSPTKGEGYLVIINEVKKYPS